MVVKREAYRACMHVFSLRAASTNWRMRIAPCSRSSTANDLPPRPRRHFTIMMKSGSDASCYASRHPNRVRWFFMVAQPSQPHSMSVDEWRELLERSNDVKHEYIDGQVY